MKKETSDWLFRYKWWGVVIFLLIIGYLAYNYEVRLILMYLVRIGMGIIIGCIVYSFTSVFTKKKFIKYSAIILVLSGIIFWYKMANKPTQVYYLQEEVIYILPKSEIDTLETSIKRKGRIQMKEDVLYILPKDTTIKNK